jgi:hypothetical protein
MPSTISPALASMKLNPAMKPTLNRTTRDTQLRPMSEKVRPKRTAARDIGSDRKRSISPLRTSSDRPRAVVNPPKAIDWAMMPGIRKST